MSLNPFIQTTCAPACHCIPTGYDSGSPFGSDCPDIGNRQFVTALAVQAQRAKFETFVLIDDDMGSKGKPNRLFYPEGCQPFPDVVDRLDDVKVCDEPFSISDDAVCAFMYESDDCDDGTMYRLKTFKNKEKAEAKGGVVTHEGRCGACSSAQDLAVNLNPAVGFLSFSCGKEFFVDADKTTADKVQEALDATAECFQDRVGFSEECAFVWASTTANSDFNGCSDDCIAFLAPCLPGGDEDLCDLLGLFGNYDDFLAPAMNSCNLNTCLDCDETQSGPIFKKFAGRTRRNSGILTSIPLEGEDPLPEDVFAGWKRDCDSIANIEQDACERN